MKQELDLSPYVKGPESVGSVYELVGVVKHMGGMGGGHYTALGKHLEYELQLETLACLVAAMWTPLLFAGLLLCAHTICAISLYNFHSFPRISALV